jgi:endogenous inhibitor of DNA gyrase (YacG/DUF329 family)
MDEMQRLMKDAEKAVSEPRKPKPPEPPVQTPRPQTSPNNKNLKPCPTCGNKVDKKANVCPHCGKKFSSVGCLGWIVASIFIIFMIGLAMSTVNTTTKEDKAQTEPLTTEYAKTIKKEHPDWLNQVCNAIGNKEVQIGMTPEQTISSWGKPERVNETTGTWGTREQWVYHDRYLYFDNGVLKSFQASR